MAAPDPQVVERQMYVDLILNGIDDPGLTLDELRGMTGGGAHVARASYAASAGRAATLDGGFAGQSLADAFGYYLVASPTEPVENTKFGVPVIWVKDNALLTPIPTTPIAPTFNYGTYTVTVPAVTGITYEVYDPTTLTWLPLVTGLTSLAGYTRPFLARVRAIAQRGYVLTATYEWNALFYTESALTLYSSDGFTGVAGASFGVTPNNTAGRVFDMAGGGSAVGAGITKWWNQNGNGEAIALGGDSTGLQATKINPAGGTNTSQGWGWLNVDADNCRIEFQVTSLVAAHARGFVVDMGSTTSNISGGPSVNISFSSTAITVVFSANGGVPSTTYTYKAAGTGTEADMLGVWKFVWVNKGYRVDAPDGQSFSKDYSASTFAFGQRARVNLIGTSPTGPYPVIDNLKLYK